MVLAICPDTRSLTPPHPLPHSSPSRPLFPTSPTTHPHPTPRYPAKYRPLIWRVLLRLPENTAEYAALVGLGTHPAHLNMHRTLPLPSPTAFARLQRLCSVLTHWAPPLAEASYLPDMVFPLATAFGEEEVAAAEAAMTLLRWWGHGWLVAAPHPPPHVTDALDRLLARLDPHLHAHLSVTGAAPGLLGWALLSSLFSEVPLARLERPSSPPITAHQPPPPPHQVLPRPAWLALWDYLFTHFDRCALSLLTPVAILHALRAPLLRCAGPAAAAQLCHSQQAAVDAAALRKTVR